MTMLWPLLYISQSLTIDYFVWQVLSPVLQGKETTSQGSSVVPKSHNPKKAGVIFKPKAVYLQGLYPSLLFLCYNFVCHIF